MAETKHSKTPWTFAFFSKVDGTEIKTVEDVAETTSASALKGDRAELWGVCLPELDADGANLVVAYTGNGPTSEANAAFIATACNQYAVLDTVTAELVATQKAYNHANHEATKAFNERDALLAQRDELAAALKSLALEARGFLSMASIGNHGVTNIAVLRRKANDSLILTGHSYIGEPGGECEVCGLIAFEHEGHARAALAKLGK